jgi:hypothetical protein
LAPRALVGLIVVLASVAPTTSLPAAQDGASALPPPADHEVAFTAEVAPIFRRACYGCHGPQRQRSDFRLDVKASALAGGQIGTAIIPGDSAKSPLIRYVAGVDATLRMPQRGELLSAEEVGILRKWIDEGAPWPDSLDAPVVSRPDHWAYQPITRPELPEVVAAHRIATPVDAFVLAKLEEHGLSFAPPADRRTLLRRVTFDLTGLPPTPDELAAFLADPGPDAYERVVDRLLMSLRYGERRARRWIDLVHFAETHGNDQDRERPHAWPYRDWLVDAFNRDLPYATFVEQQLAADVLFPDQPRAVPALGFLAAGPWDESSQLNIGDDTLDKQIARNLDRDDMVMTTMATFVSTTVQCARCHNHKFDPVAQTDYYRLQSVFAGIDRADRPFDLDPALHARRQAILRRELDLERLPAEAPELQTDALRAEVATFEREVAGDGGIWHAVEVENTGATGDGAVSTGGATATRLADGSLVFSGVLPERDTYVARVHVPLRQVTALRLDVLADDSLPMHGPGRQDNGNLHLSELTVTAVRAGTPAVRTPVAIACASADFDQEGWTAAMAIDGKPETAWGIHPQVGRAHHAVFEFRDVLEDGVGCELEIRLEQLHGEHHLIGRMRLAATDAPRPVRASTPPERVRALLAKGDAERSAAERGELARHVLLRRIDAELAALPPPQLVYAGTTDFTPESNFVPARGVRPVHVLARGEVGKPLTEVGPGALGCVVGLPGELAVDDALRGTAGEEGARRAALARWITDRRNGLTWRSIVNRVWQDHFGRGIVATPSDFGAMGAAPSHPELLDWLAAWFRDGGGRLKELDRLLVTSAAYRQSTRADARASALDADDALLWRMRRARLDAEEIRDALLAVSGELDLTAGGPSVRQFVESPGIHVTPNVDYDAFDADRPEMKRRSIWRFLFRTLPDPFMETMDCPDASQLAPTRSASVTALQALSLLNNRFVVVRSEHLAARITAETAEGDAQILTLFRRVLLRDPTELERADFRGFVAQHGLANAARLLFNCSEFVFVE